MGTKKENYGLWYHTAPYIIYFVPPIIGAYTVDSIQTGTINPDVVVPFALNHLGGTVIAGAASLVGVFALALTAGYITDPLRLTRNDKRMVRHLEEHKRLKTF